MSYYQTIYNRLRAAGLTEDGALGILGNWDCESNCESFRVQGDFSSYRTISHQYTEDVEDGSISRQQFANDGKGYGLAQWTFCTRKENLYDFCKNLGVPIDNEAAQVAFALKEMPTEAPGLLEQLKTSDDLWACTDLVCRKFEKPYYNNVDDRFRAANRIKNEIDLNPELVTPEPSGPEKPMDCALDLPELTVGSKGVEVYLLQSALTLRGCPCGKLDGDFGPITAAAVNRFKQNRLLPIDGKVDSQTWIDLLSLSTI